MSELSFVARWKNAVRDSRLPPTTKLVAHTLGTYLRSDGSTGSDQYHRPSILTLARGAGLGPERRHTKNCAARDEKGRVVEVGRCDCPQPSPKDNTATKAAIRHLEESGLLDVERVRGQTGWRYQAKIPKETPADPGEDSDAGVRTHAHDSPGIPRLDEHESPANASAIPRPGVDESEDQSEDQSDDLVVVDYHEKEEELEKLLGLLGTFTPAQRETVRAAWTEKTGGVRALVGETFAARGVRSRVGLFMSRIADGEHRTIEIKPALSFAPLPEPEPCSECNFSFGHRYGCRLAPNADRAAPDDCPECGYGGARPHLADCSLAAEAVA